MSPAIVECARAEALFVTTVQRSDSCTNSQIKAAVTEAVHAYGTRGCAALVAQEFGDHPENAVLRMKWALDTTRAAFRSRRTRAYSVRTTGRRRAAS